MMKRVAALASLALGISLSLASTAWGATRLVDDDGVQCPSAQYHTIQAAVNAASSGDTVLVCNGLYPEEVTIPEGTDNLRLEAKTVHGAIVRSAQPILVDGASGARIERFVIEGDGPTVGTGIGVGNDGGSPGSTQAITGNLVRRVNTGIALDDAQGGDIEHNTIQEFGGYGVAGESASNMSLGASGTIRSNTIIGTPGSTGVFFQQDFGQTIIVGALIAGNQISGNTGTGRGIDVHNAFVDVRSNQIFDNGIGINYAAIGTVGRNHVNSNEQQGILTFGSGNEFRSNDARGNSGLDCEEHGTNTWAGNHGLDSSPPAICPRGTVPAGPAPTATRLVVDDDHGQCARANFTTIQAAVNAADPGDTVLVCPGSYPENVTIPEGKDGLRLLANVKQRAIVRSFAIFGAKQVEISRFLIEGNGQGAGIAIHNSGESASAAAIRDTVVRRVEKGIDLSDTVVRNVERNTIQEFSLAGVFAFSPPQGMGAIVDVRASTFIGTPGSIGLDFSVFHFIGSVIGDIAGNDVLGNGVAGVSSSGAFPDLRSNHVFGNGDGVTGTVGTVRGNLIFANTGKGLSVSSPFAPIRSNDARGNGGLDCEDQDSNTWIGNRGLDASPPGICRP